jgi:hypothetical protein
MKVILTLSFCLSAFITFSQNDRKPPAQKDCIVSKEKMSIKHDTLLLYKVAEPSPFFDTLIYTEIDSNRLIGLGSNIELILPLLTKGLINANLLKNIGSSSETYSHFLSERGGAILKIDKSIDLWSKECIFFGLEGEERDLRKPHVRVFKLGVASFTRSSTSILYLETTNLFGTINMTNAEFLKEAHVSCIMKWYAQY